MALNKLLTQVTTTSELKQILFEIIFNNTDKISKITKESVNNATAYGIAKLAQKILKDVAISEGRIFYELSSGSALDEAVKLTGAEERLIFLGFIVLLAMTA